MKYKIWYIFFLMLFISCSTNDKFIYYSYKGTTITRYDKETNETYFYYGKYNNRKLLPNKYIRSTFTGFDGLMSGYLIFDPEKVKLLQIEGEFKTFGDEPLFKLIEYDTVDFIEWSDSIGKNYNNVVEVSDGINIEKERNKRNNSKVKVIYPR